MLLTGASTDAQVCPLSKETRMRRVWDLPSGVAHFGEESHREHVKSKASF